MLPLIILSSQSFYSSCFCYSPNYGHIKRRGTLALWSKSTIKSQYSGLSFYFRGGDKHGFVTMCQLRLLSMISMKIRLSSARIDVNLCNHVKLWRANHLLHWSVHEECRVLISHWVSCFLQKHKAICKLKLCFLKMTSPLSQLQHSLKCICVCMCWEQICLKKLRSHSAHISGLFKRKKKKPSWHRAGAADGS